VFQDVINKMHV